MPCKEPRHVHAWPSSGHLVIEKCERFCHYCTGEAAEHEWKFAWFLRRHVRTVHLKEGGGDHPGVTVAEGWSERPEGMSQKFRKMRAEAATKPKNQRKVRGKAKIKVKTETRPRKRAVKKEVSDSDADSCMTDNQVTSDEHVSEETMTSHDDDSLTRDNRPAQSAMLLAGYEKDESLYAQHMEEEREQHKMQFSVATQDLAIQGLNAGRMSAFDVAEALVTEADRLTGSRADLLALLRDVQ